jgi:ubiquinone/menaquinone biosynthesis C-methylase UbiE
MDTSSLYDNRVEYYLKYRPGYPDQYVSDLIKLKILQKSDVIVDMGCGTGLLAEIFLRNRNKVIGIEPNLEMRQAAENYLKKYLPISFKCLNGKAESSTLDPISVNHIVCGESFHWFETHSAIKEFQRILIPNGYLMIFSNWEYKNTDFAKQFNLIIQKHQFESNVKPPPKIEWNQIFHNGKYEKIQYPMRKEMNFEQILGYALSLSRTPLPGDKAYEFFKNELKNAFNRFEKNTKILFEFKTKLKFGKLS